MYHLFAFSESVADAATAEDLAAPTDEVLTVRNSHLILTDEFNLIGAYANGAGMVVPRFNAPTLNQIARHTLFPFNRAATISSPPNFIDMRDFPLPLPMNEEIAVEVGNDSGGAAVQNVFLVLASPTWNRNIPSGKAKITVRATGAVAGIAQSWSLQGALTFLENLKGGYYTIYSAWNFDAGTLATRFIFPNANNDRGRVLRPGILNMEAVANIPSPLSDGGWGPIGSFHSFDPPRIQIFANATGASAQELRLGLIYHGDQKPAGWR